MDVRPQSYTMPIAPVAENTEELASLARANVVPFAAKVEQKVERASRWSPNDGGFAVSGREDWPLILLLVAAFALAFVRVTYVLACGGAFGPDESLALVFLLALPLLLREPALELLQRFGARPRG